MELEQWIDRDYDGITDLDDSSIFNLGIEKAAAEFGMILGGSDEAFVISPENSDCVLRLRSGVLEWQRVSGLTARWPGIEYAPKCHWGT